MADRVVGGRQAQPHPAGVADEAVLAGPLFARCRWVSFVVETLGPGGKDQIARAGDRVGTQRRATTWSRIAADHARPDKPRWSPDGRALTFVCVGRLLRSVGRPSSTRSRHPGRGALQVTHFGSPRWRVDPDMGGSCEVGIATGRLVLAMRTVKGISGSFGRNLLKIAARLDLTDISPCWY